MATSILDTLSREELQVYNTRLSPRERFLVREGDISIQELMARMAEREEDARVRRESPQQVVLPASAPTAPPEEPSDGFFAGVERTIDKYTDILGGGVAAIISPQASEKVYQLNKEEYKTDTIFNVPIPGLPIKVWHDRTEEQAAAAKKVLETDIAALDQKAQALSQAADAAFDGSIGAYAARGLADALGSYKSAFSLIGGVAGGVITKSPAGAAAGAALGSVPQAKDTFFMAYREARELGATIEEAESYAAVITAIEFGTETALSTLGAGLIGAGTSMFKAGSKQELKQQLLGRVTQRPVAAAATGAAIGAATEGAGEAATGAVQFEASKLMEERGMFSSPEAQAALARKNAEDAANYWDDRVREGIAGAIIGGAVGGPTRMLQSAADAGAEVSKTHELALNRMLDAEQILLQDLDRQVAEGEARRVAEEEQRVRDEAFAKIEEERDAAVTPEEAFTQAEEQARLEREAGFQTMEREAQAERIRQAGVEGGPLESPMAGAMAGVEVKPVTPEQVAEQEQAQQQRQAAQQRAVEQQQEQARVQEEQAQRAALVDEVVAAQEATRKAAEKKRAEQEKAAKAAQDKRRKEIIRQTIAEFPDADAAQITSVVEQRLREAPAPTPQIDTTKAAPQPAAQPRAEAPALPKPATTARQPASVDATLQGDAEMRRRIAEVVGEDNVATQDATLAMVQREAASPATPAMSIEDASKQIKNVIEGMVRKDSRAKADIRSLINQGKIRFARTKATTKYAGLPVDNIAQYDRNTGEMTIFLDKLDQVDPDKATGAVIAAVHEATHAGQFNDRRGRPEILKQIMGADKYGKANELIRKAAKDGNKIAQRAVQQVEELRDERVSEFETAAYFTHEVMRARERGESVGRLGNLVNDMVSSARNFLREEAGMDIPVTINDLAHAVTLIPGEIAQTEIKGLRPTPMSAPVAPLNMVVGPQATGFGEAEAAGRTFQYEGVDETPRFEIDDSGTRVNATRVERQELIDGKEIPLSQILVHPELQRQYPDLMQAVTVNAADLGLSAKGQWNRGKITLSKDYLATASNEDLRRLLLHETQHAVQQLEGFVQGTSARQFYPQDFDALTTAVTTLENDRNSLIKKFEIVPAIRNLSTDNRAKLNNILKLRGVDMNNIAANRDNIARIFLESRLGAEHPAPAIANQQQRFNDISAKLIEAKDARYSAESKAFAKYLANLGEMEARNVELRADMTPAEREAAPFVETMAQDEASQARGIRAEQATAERAAVPAREETDILAMSLNKEMAEAIIAGKRDLLERGKDANTVANAIRHGHQTRGRGSMEATSYAKHMDKAIDETAKQTGQDADSIKQEIMELFKEAVEAKGLTRATKWKEFSNKYPTLSKSVLDFRDAIDHATLEIIRIRAADPRPMTDKEQAEIRKLMDRRGFYLTRAYASYVPGRTGRKFATRRWNAYQRAMQALKDNGAINERDMESFRAVSRAVNFLYDQVKIPDETTMQAMKMDTLERLYDTWMGTPVARSPVSNLTGDAKRAAMIADLSRRAETLSTDEIFNEAEQAAKTLLGLVEDGSPLAQYFSNVARDPGVLKELKNVPPPIRELLGEIKDPTGRMMQTLAKQFELIARNNTYAELKEKGLGTFIVPAADVRKPGNEQFTARLAGDQYGPLNGYYTTPEIKELIDVQRDVVQTWAQAYEQARVSTIGPLSKKVGGTIVRTAQVASLAQKFALLILNPYAYYRNFIGSPAMLVGDGNIDVRTWGKGLKGAADYVTEAWNGDSTEFLRDLVQFLELESSDIGEMQRELAASTDAVVNEQSFIKVAFEQGIKRPTRAMSATYAVMDNWTKMANWANRVQILEAMYKAQGQETRYTKGPKKGQVLDSIKREAGDDINFTNITYSRAPRWVRWGESVGITQFANYFAEVFRTTGTGYVQAVKDLRRASELAKSGQTEAAAIIGRAGLQRAVGHTLVRAVAPVIAMQTMSALSGDDEDNRLRRMLLSQFGKDQDIVYIGRDENGMPVYKNVSTYDPFGPVSDIFRAGWYAPQGEEFGNIANYLAELYINPRVIPNTIQTIAGNNVPMSRVEQIWPEYVGAMRDALEDQTGASVTASNKIFKLMDPLTPGILAGYEQHSRIGELTDTPEDAKTVASFAKAMNKIGMRGEVFNPARTLEQLARDSTKDRLSNPQGLRQLIATREGLTDNQLINEAGKLAQAENERLAHARQVAMGLEAWGYTPAQSAAMMKQAKFVEEDIKRVYGLDPYTVTLTLKAIDEDAAKFYGKATSPEEKARRANMINQNKDAVLRNAATLQSMGIVVKEN